jgi:hypothetical protein
MRAAECRYRLLHLGAEVRRPNLFANRGVEENDADTIAGPPQGIEQLQHAGIANRRLDAGCHRCRAIDEQRDRCLRFVLPFHDLQVPWWAELVYIARVVFARNVWARAQQPHTVAGPAERMPSGQDLDGMKPDRYEYAQRVQGLAIDD